ncbi:MAG: pentapeptide repeat-containing protein [Sandaracinaceae bacterium]|nr:pentapeptide repeat-containing protein [Sandaracinaceae bacterium]
MGASLEGASPEGASLEGASLEGASLEGASLEGASPEGASPEGASPEGASLEGASPEGASLEGAEVTGRGREAECGLRRALGRDGSTIAAADPATARGDRRSPNSCGRAGSAAASADKARDGWGACEPARRSASRMARPKTVSRTMLLRGWRLGLAPRPRTPSR